MTGFQALVIKDGNGTSQNMESYLDTNSNICGATVPTDGAGNILGLAATPIQSQIQNNVVTYNAAGFTRPANATAYAAAQLVANSTTAATVNTSIGSGTYSITAGRANNIGGFIPQVQLIKTSTTLTNAIFRVHFYNSSPTVTNGDGAAWITGNTGYLGNFDVTMTQSFSAAASGLGIPTVGSGLCFTPVSGAQTLYWLIEARAAYTPTSGETFSLNIWVN